jgi:hypothetical protein
MSYTYRISENADITLLPNDKLETLQEAVGGYIQLVSSPYGDCYVNEEGLLLGLKPNVFASAMLGQHIVGAVVLCTKMEMNTNPSTNEK